MPSNMLFINNVPITCHFRGPGNSLFEKMKQLKMPVPETYVCASAEEVRNRVQRPTTPSSISISNETTEAAYDRIKRTSGSVGALNFANASQLGNTAFSQNTPQEQALMHKFPSVFASYLLYMATHDKRDGRYLVGNEIAVTEISPGCFILAGAMPNLYSESQPTEDEYKEKIKTLIQIAAALNISNLILGAWGCGAFGNDPATVATAFKEVIDETQTNMMITFAIPGAKDAKSMYQIFKDALQATEAKLVSDN